MVYVVGFIPSIAALRNYFVKTWPTVTLVQLFKHDHGFFLLKCSNDQDVHSIIDSGSCFYNSRPIIMRPWRLDFDYSNDIMSIMPLWIRLPNLPLNCWTSDFVSKIASLVGSPVCADECTSQQMRVTFARLMVEVDVTKPFVRQVLVDVGAGVVKEQKVIFEWAPPFFDKCKKVGHN